MKKIYFALAALVVLSAAMFGTMFVSGQIKDTKVETTNTAVDVGCESGICGPGLCDGRCEGRCGVPTCTCRT